MAYKITTVNRKQTANQPNFSTWLDSQDSSIISGFPKYAGMTPSEVVSSLTNDVDSKKMTVGLVDTESTESEDGLTFTFTQTWETYDSYLKSASSNIRIGKISCNTASNTVTSHENVLFNRLEVLTPGSLIRQLDYETNTFIYIGTVSSIDSPSSLTLTSNAEIDLVNEQASCTVAGNDVIIYLQQLYKTEYPFSTIVTEANI